MSYFIDVNTHRRHLLSEWSWRPARCLSVRWALSVGLCRTPCLSERDNSNHPARGSRFPRQWTQHVLLRERPRPRQTDHVHRRRPLSFFSGPHLSKRPAHEKLLLCLAILITFCSKRKLEKKLLLRLVTKIAVTAVSPIRFCHARQFDNGVFCTVTLTEFLGQSVVKGAR